jgi:hypothetical protein
MQIFQIRASLPFWLFHFYRPGNPDFSFISTVSFTDLDQGREILSRFSLPKSMKHSVEIEGVSIFSAHSIYPFIFNGYKICLKTDRYSVFQGFSKAKSANGGSILSSSQFLILPQLLQKIKLASKVVKVDSIIIIWLPKI